VEIRNPLSAVHDHLTYCLNIHPGETWEANFAAIRDKATAVRQRVAPGRRFGLGLRLGRQAADELTGRRGALGDFRRFLADEGLYVFTVNGFPYGRFHGTAVKQAVYAPDWRAPERRDYTMLLIDILAALLPEGVPGSISTVPGSYRAWVSGADDARRMAAMLAETAAHAADVRRRTARDICVALEPEPDCFVETTDEAIGFLTGPLAAAAPAEVLRRHVGVCLDTAHAAVEFEDPAEALRKLSAAHVRVAKVQLSAALRAAGDAESLRRLADFADPVYLHQVKVREAGGGVRSFADLPEALAAPPAGEWRVHFHVPLFWSGDAVLGSTAELLGTAFWRAALAATPHLEIETYTFDVLPGELRLPDVTDSIAREYDWVLRQLAAVGSSGTGA